MKKVKHVLAVVLVSFTGLANAQDGNGVGNGKSSHQANVHAAKSKESTYTTSGRKVQNDNPNKKKGLIANEGEKGGNGKTSDGKGNGRQNGEKGNGRNNTRLADKENKAKDADIAGHGVSTEKVVAVVQRGKKLRKEANGSHEITDGGGPGNGKSNNLAAVKK
ncbi:hypothetical protein [Dyadobacter psychrophilus]|nr:hypothetical protein [Dyadobacter psychrophilus]